MTGWRATFISLFPDLFPGPLGASILGSALARDVWGFDVVDLRAHGLGKHRTVDDTPAGGGAGMVLRADVAAAAIDSVAAEGRPLLMMSPRGERFDQAMAHQLAAGPGAILFCGRFEAIDQRVIDRRGMREVSIGDFVLAGGEVAAMAITEACVRLLPGVVGASASLVEESFETGLLEHPHYTRPHVWEGASIPDILTSGDHKRIEKWRKDQAVELTKARRPDLYAPFRNSVTPAADRPRNG
ncbi:tRNA (guanosine(37)-N1)-methyltransferase TrmD [bacterium]|nr:tRNA (guanosine(37)-N1)-methyltransferase TrmD [bacterium]